MGALWRTVNSLFEGERGRVCVCVCVCGGGKKNRGITHTHMSYGQTTYKIIMSREVKNSHSTM